MRQPTSYLLSVLIGLCTAGGLGAAAMADEAPKVSRWEKTIAGFEQQDAKSPPPAHGIVFVGSSSIRMWDLNKWFPDQPAINRGFGGSEFSDAIQFAERIVVKYQPRVVVVYSGDNDLAKGKSVKTVAADFRRFASLLRERLPRTHVVVIAIKPSLKRWNLADKIRKANTAIAKECERHERLTFMDVFQPMLNTQGEPRPELFIRDGLHLNEQGYREWTRQLQGILSKLPADAAGTKTSQQP